MFWKCVFFDFCADVPKFCENFRHQADGDGQKRVKIGVLRGEYG